MKKYKKRKVKRDICAKLIPLTRNHYAIVDSKNFLWLNRWNWYLSISHHNYYAARQIRRNGKVKYISMHESILGKPPEGKEIDHIDGYGLNNMLYNMRFCSCSENFRNSRKHNKHKRFSSKYKGVSKGRYREKSQTQTWKAYIYLQRKLKHIGIFSSEEEAAKAYDAKALENFGEFARINFPKIV